MIVELKGNDLFNKTNCFEKIIYKFKLKKSGCCSAVQKVTSELL